MVKYSEYVSCNEGKIIKNEILEGNKPEYGKSVIENLSQELVSEYGKDTSKL